MQLESNHELASKYTILLLSAYFTLLSFGKTFNLPLIAISLIASYYILRLKAWTKPSSVETKLILCVFLSIYVPVLFSLYNADVPERTIKFLLTYPLFAIVGYFLATQPFKGSSLRRFTKWLNFLILVWGLSATWQLISPHTSPFGPSMNLYQGMHSRYTSYGVDGGLMLGIILSGILPFIALSNLHHFGKTYALLLLCGTLFLILISGTRSAIVAAFVGSIVCTVYLAHHYQIRWQSLLKLSLITAVVATVALKVIPFPQSVIHKMQQTTQILEDFSIESVNFAVSGRLELWRDAIAVGMLNPVTGKGVNSFRYTQPLVAPADSSFVSDGGTGANHTHQLILEVWAGTGVVGLVGLTCLYILLALITVSAVKTKSLLAVGAVSVLWATFFPLNTHNNFYGSWLTGWFWVWIGVTLALIRQGRSSIKSA